MSKAEDLPWMPKYDLRKNPLTVGQLHHILSLMPQEAPVKITVEGRVYPILVVDYHEWTKEVDLGGGRVPYGNE